jgi:predicted phosphoribosyltransferase
MMFRNRDEAAHLLAGKLRSYRGKNPLILAVPRGAVPMGRILAEQLGGELDVILVRKLGAPGNPELAIGAVGETGEVYMGERTAYLRISNSYVQKEIENQKDLLRKRREQYSPFRQPIDPAGRIVIIVDDGIATGATMMAGLKLIRQKKPERLIVAAAVAPPSTVDVMTREADELAILDTPANFYAVGQFFADFAQVSDREVIELLSRPILANPGLSAL